MPPDSQVLQTLNDPGVMWQQALALAPEIVLTVFGLLALVVDIAFFRRKSSESRRVWLGLTVLVGAVLAVASASLAITKIEMSTVSAPARDQKAEAAPAEPAAAPTVAAVQYGTAQDEIFFGTLSADIATTWMNVALGVLLAMVVGLSMSWGFTEHWGEYYALLLWATVGMMLLIAAQELLTLFLSLEMMTICLYLMASLEKSRRRSAEAGLKYFVYGSVSSALFLFGLSLIYGLTGTTRLEAIRQALVAGEIAPGLSGNVAGATAILLVLVGFGFKVAAVPFHQWAPDTYEGAPAPVAAWIGSGSKLASFVALIKVLVYGLGPWSAEPGNLSAPGWVGLLALIAAVSMTYGNFAALAQRNFKRMLAYSSIAHAGYILVGVLAVAVSEDRGQAGAGVLYYVVTYAFATVGAFAVAAWLARDLGSDEIEDLNGLGARAPAMALCIVLLMLSLIGMPPLAGFFGKLVMFMQAMNTGETGNVPLTWLVALGLFNSVVSAFYYVRVLKAMFLRPPSTTRPIGPVPSGVFWSVALATAVTLGFGIKADLLLLPMEASAVQMVPTTSSPFRTEEVGTPEERQREAERRAASLDKSKLMSSGGGGGGGRRGRGSGDGARPEGDNSPER